MARKQKDKPRDSRPAGRSPWRLILPCLIALAAIAVYAQVHSHDFVNYDDPDYVTENPHVRAGLTLGGLKWAFTSGFAANWIPVTWLSHMLDCQIFGIESGWHHLTNVAIHVASALLLFFGLRRMTGDERPSAVLAFLFVMHPLHVESVAWVSERKDVLSGFFWSLGIWLYARYVERPNKSRYALLAAAFCFGLMAKQMIVTLPFVLLLLDVWPLKRPVSKRLVLEKIPLFALSACASVVAYVVQQHGGAIQPVEAVTLTARIANAIVSYVIYIGQIFWPARLAPFYPYPHHTSLWVVFAAAAVLIAITFVVVRFARRRPYLAVGWFWYIGTLVPVIGFVQIGEQSHADRYTYIPSIGIFIMLVWGFAEILQRWPRGKTICLAAAGGACAACIVLTSVQLGYWRNSESLFRHAIEVTDGNYVAHTNLGAALRKQGRVDEAAVEYERALSIRPHFIDAENDLGEALLLEGKVPQAIPHISEALRQRPDFADAHINMGDAFLKTGRADDSATQYRAALVTQPENAIAHAGLGMALEEQGRVDDALRELSEAIAIDPEYAGAHYDRGLLLANSGRTAEAVIEFSAAVRLEPQNVSAHYNLGTALGAEGRLQEAIAAFKEAIRQQPDYRNAHVNLGKAYASLGRFNEAIAEFSEAVRIDPNFAEAREDLDETRALQAESQAARREPAR